MDLNALVQSAQTQSRLKAGETFSKAQEKFDKGKELLDATREVIEGSVGGIALGEGIRKGGENLKKLGGGARRLARASVKLNKRLGIGTRKGTLREDGGAPAEEVGEGEDLGEAVEQAPIEQAVAPPIAKNDLLFGEGGLFDDDDLDDAQAVAPAEDLGMLGDPLKEGEGVANFIERMNKVAVNRRARVVQNLANAEAPAEPVEDPNLPNDPMGFDRPPVVGRGGGIQEAGADEGAGDIEMGNMGADAGADAGVDAGVDAGAVGETAEITGETGLTAGLETFGAGAEALGDTEIASVVGIPLGIATDVLGGAGLLAGIITGGVGLVKEGQAHLGHAQDQLNASIGGMTSLAGRVGTQVSNHADLSRMR